MRINYKNILGVTLLLLLSVTLNAQETIIVPLNNPSKPGFLNVRTLQGSITIKGTNRKDIKVTGTARKKKQYYSGRKTAKKNREGLKRITNNNLQFKVYQFENEIKVKGSTYGTTDFEIEIPKNFSLKLSTNNSGDIYVENVNGIMDVSNLNGKITLKDISGAVSADALNKDIIVNFISVTPNTPMAFSSLNGDIDITFPKSFKADVKIKSERGDIFTDFDLNTKKSKADIIKSKEGDGNSYKIKVEKWITGTINGGGAELLFKNYNGDVILRSK